MSLLAELIAFYVTITKKIWLLRSRFSPGNNKPSSATKAAWCHLRIFVRAAELILNRRTNNTQAYEAAHSEFQDDGPERLLVKDPSAKSFSPHYFTWCRTLNQDWKLCVKYLLAGF
jgi:hypothetical protein